MKPKKTPTVKLINHGFIYEFSKLSIADMRDVLSNFKNYWLNYHGRVTDTIANRQLIWHDERACRIYLNICSQRG